MNFLNLFYKHILKSLYKVTEYQMSFSSHKLYFKLMFFHTVVSEHRRIDIDITVHKSASSNLLKYAKD